MPVYKVNIQYLRISLRAAALHNNCYALVLDNKFLLRTALGARTSCLHYSAFVRVIYILHAGDSLFPYQVLERRPGQGSLIDCVVLQDI